MLDKRIKKVSMEKIDPELLVKLIQLKTKTGLNSSVYEIPNGPIKILLHKGKKIQAKKVNTIFAEDLHELYRAGLTQEIVDRLKADRKIIDLKQINRGEYRLKVKSGKRVEE